MNIICIGCLVGKFKHTFEHFKQYCTHFHIVFHPHIYQKHSNNIIQTPLPNIPELKSVSKQSMISLEIQKILQLLS